jgi:hypothetical protein
VEGAGAREGGVSGWVSVVGWRRFQHYDPSKRQPPWIKTYTELLDDEDYLKLTARQRAILHGIWLAYASSRCELGASPVRLASRLGLDGVQRRDLDSLSSAGFIEIVASKTLAEGYHDASPRAHASETETETETETEEVSTPLFELQDAAAPQGRGNGWVDNLSQYTGCRYVRGEMAVSAKYDPLGTERPPSDWPHDRPTREEIRRALKERSVA